MASGGGSKQQRSADPKTEDPSIISSSQSGRQYNQKSHPSTHPGTNRQRQDRQTNQQRRHQQNQRTPTSNEKRRQEHWKVPVGNSQTSPLAKDLFGAQNNPQFRFDYNEQYRGGGHHQYGYGYGYQPSGYRGGYHGNRNTKNHQGASKHEGQSSSHGPKVNHRQQNGPASSESVKSTKNNQKTTPKTADCAPKLSDSERKVQFFETLMKNGEKSENLKITVTDKPSEKKVPKETKATEKVGKPTGKSMLEDAIKKAPADKFSNPLMGGSTEQDSTVEQKTKETETRPSQKPSGQPSDGKQKSQSTPENSGEKPEKKKKKRNREKKKKKDKNAEGKNETPKSDSRPQSQASDNCTEKVDKTTSKTTPVDKAPDEPDSKHPQEVKGQAADKEKKEEKEKPSPSGEQDAAAKKLEELGLEQAEKRLEKDLIFKLEKKSPTFPEANYFCKLCSHHLNTIAHAHKHIKDKRHKRESKAKQQDELLRQLKSPPTAAVASLDRHLVRAVEENMMTQDDAKERSVIVERLNEIVKKGLEGCSVVSYGSSVTTIGLKTSDVNVDVQYEGDLRTPAVLLSLLSLLKDSSEFTDVQEDFDAKVPRIEIKDKLTGVRCALSIGNIKALHTTRLLKLYTQIEPAVLRLSKLFRLWGYFCQVDKQQDGSLPPHAFTLMTIFYLQQKHGLPVLHEIIADHDIEQVLEEGGDEHDVLKLVDDEWWYHPTAPPAGKENDKSEDAEDDVDETAEFSESDDDLEVIFSESPWKEVPGPLGDDSGSKTDDKPLVPVKLKKCFDGEQKSLADLWLGFLKYYSAQFDIENLIITIRSSGKVTRSDRGWSHRRIAVEDPCSPKWNLCKPMNSQALFNYFVTRLKHSVFYFHTAHNSALNKLKKSQKKSSKPDKKPVKNHKQPKTVDDFVDTILKSVYEEVKGRSSHLNDKEENKGQSSKPESQKDQKGSDDTNSISRLAGSVVDDIMKDFKDLDLSKEHKVQDDKEEQINYDSCYKFTKDALMDGKVPVIVCSIWKKEGHRKKNCPEELEIKVNPLPPFTHRLKLMLDHVCRESFELYVPKEDEVRMREKVCIDLFDFLQKNYDRNVRMCLFGSSRNRFTFRGSDLDVCMTFEGNATGEAQRNTSMLALYASIDDRCRMLGYAVKAFVKQCCIGDASRGSLSSYAYILMVIYFLQQRDPPVLPVLQELYTGDKMPDHIIDGWNSWFFDSIGSLNKIWPDFGKNRESLGELWLGMLRFYTEKFDFSRQVVCIRQKKLLTAFEKEWASKCNCIEDPFDLNHNLGAGVSRKMTNFILKVFVKARERFGSEPSEREWNHFFG